MNGAAATGNGKGGRRLLAVTILGSSIVFVDGTVVNVALPAMQEALGATTAGMQWVMDSYLLFLSALILVGGAAGDRYGRRRVFALGVVLFALASLACGLAPDAGTLVAARAFQGMAGALLVPGSLALIRAGFSDAERGRAIGTWAGFSALATALGPPVGGWLVDTVSWRAIFFLNLPLAVLTLWLARGAVRESRAEGQEGRPLDWAGAVAAALGFGLLTWGMIGVAERGPDGAVMTASVGGVLCLAAFLLIERRAAAPMLPLSLFRSRAFSGANLLTLLLYAALSGALFLLPFSLMHGRGYTAAETGAAMLPFSLALGFLSRWAGGLIGSVGARLPLVAGPLVVAAGFALLALGNGQGHYWTAVFPGLALAGIGMAVAVAPLTTVVMEAVDERHAGTASGINNAAARLAGLLAVAALGSAAVALFGAGLEARLQDLGLPDGVAVAILGESGRLAVMPVPEGLDGAYRAGVASAVRGAFDAALRDAMLIAAGLAAASAGVAALTIGGRRRSRGP